MHVTACRAAIAWSVPPEVFEARGAQCRVSRGVLDRDMAQPVLDCSGVDTAIGQRVAARMPQHVEVDRKRKLCARADGLDQPVDGVWRERRAALGGEHIAAVRMLPAQCRQRAQFVATDWMNRRLAVLGPPDMKGS